jgi:hypothetical protein
MTSPHPDKIVSENISPVISAVAERIHYAEGRRANYTVMALALIAGGTSILVFAFGSIGQMWLKYAAIVASFGFIAVGLLVIYTYGRQTNQYPYTSATKTWKWFYRDALPDRDAFGLKPNELAQTQKERITKAYTDQFAAFKIRIAQLASDKSNTEQDIEQLYSLHVNELYKNLYLSRLRTLFNKGLIFSILAGFIAGVWGWYSEYQALSLKTGGSENRLWSQRIEYRLLSEPLADAADIAVHIVVTNKSTKPISVTALIVRDRRGWQLPTENKFQSSLPRVVAPHGKGELYASIRTTRYIWNEHYYLEAILK